MPSFLRRRLIVLFFTLISVSGFSQTLYYSYNDIFNSGDEIILSVDERRDEIKELMLLDLPFLLGTKSFEEISVPDSGKENLEKMILSRVRTFDDDKEAESDVESRSDAVVDSVTPGESTSDADRAVSNEEEMSANGEPVPERNQTSCDPVFAIIGIENASAEDAYIYVRMKKAEFRVLSDQRYYGEIAFDFFLAYDNRVDIFGSEIRAIGLSDSEEGVINEIRFSLRVSLKSELNSFFGKAGSPYIVNFINSKKVVIAHGRLQGAFPGAFYRILRHEISETGEVGERVIGRLYVERCEENYSFCRILYSLEQPVPGDGIQKIPGVGIHQSFGYGLLISSLAVTETESDIYINHLLSARWVVNREMPIVKPAFGFEILAGNSAQLDTVGMMKTPVIGNLYVGMQVDRFFHCFSFSPFVDLGFAFTTNAMENKKPLMWVTCKAGAKFLWMFHERVGVYLEGGYISWLGIPGKESVFEDSQYIYYAPNDYTGGFGGIGFTVMY